MKVTLRCGYYANLAILAELKATLASPISIEEEPLQDQGMSLVNGYPRTF